MTKLHPVDEQVIESARTGEGCAEITTEEQLQALADAAKETFDSFEAQAKAIMTPERAAFVRWLRVDEGYTWRGVAARCFEEWKEDWYPSSNQLMGVALCEAAAPYFDEHGGKDPWN